MVLNVTGALLDLNSENFKHLRGDAISANIHPTSTYSSGSTVQSLKMFAVPRHTDWVMYPYERNYPAYAKRCHSLGERCGINLQVEIISDRAEITEAFWKHLMEVHGGVPGQQAQWRGRSQKTKPCNSHGDRVGIGLGEDHILIYIRGRSKNHVTRKRVFRFSQIMHEEMTDQSILGNLEKESEAGRSVWVQHDWTREDRDGWDEACRWILDQYERLWMISRRPDHGDGETSDPDREV